MGGFNMIIIIGLVILLLVLFLYSACIISSKYSRLEECLVKNFKFKDYELFFEIGTYTYNNRLAVLCHTEDEPFSDITINLPEIHLNSIDEACIDPMCKDCGLYQALIDNGVINEVIREKVPYNMGKYDLVRFDMNKLKEFDPKGYEEYLNEIGYDEDISLNPSI